MKKGMVVLIICAIVVSYVTSYTCATVNIQECPNFKIVIDGKAKEYTDVPIIANNRTLLPLRALFTNLGVLNDDAHIVWNDSEKSVTAYKDNTKIYLKISSPKAYINDEPVDIDVSPVIYKNRTYIPARFVAQALGKKVIWEDITKSVLIKDESEFNHIKDIFDKAVISSRNVGKLKFKAEGSLSLSPEDENVDTILHATGECDNKKKIMHMNMNMKSVATGLSMDVEYYLVSNKLYIKNPLTGKWEEKDISLKASSSMNNVDDSAAIKATETACAGFTEEKGSNPEEILLKGDIYLDEFISAVNTSTSMDLSNIQFDKCYTEIYLDKDTGLMKREYVDLTITVKLPQGMQSINQKINYTFSDYNGDFEVNVPEELKTLQ